jgi:hypothetical protein
MKPCTMRVPEIGECSCWYEGIQKQKADNSWTLTTRVDSMVTHFQLPPCEFH